MDYRRHYTLLIERARYRILDGYKEQHHIIPKCIGGTNDPDNLVYLTPEEHYVAHQLLVKIYPHELKLISAIVIMSGRKRNRDECNNKVYGWLRKRNSELRKGIKHSEESNIKRSLKQKGIPKTADEIKKNSASHLGNVHSQETKNKISKSQKGKIPWNKGKSKETDICLRKMSEDRKGYIPWNKGKKKE